VLSAHKFRNRGIRLDIGKYQVSAGGRYGLGKRWNGNVGIRIETVHCLGKAKDNWQRGTSDVNKKSDKSTTW